MAKYDGKDMVFIFGAFTIPAGHLTVVDWPEARDELEATGSTQDWKEFYPSEMSSEITVNVWDDVAGTIRAAFPINSAEATAQFFPQGNTSGKPKFSATAFVKNSAKTYTHNQMVAVTISMRVNGAVTPSTVA